MAMNMQAMAQQIASMSEEQREQLLSRMTPEQRQQAIQMHSAMMDMQHLMGCFAADPQKPDEPYSTFAVLHSLASCPTMRVLGDPPAAAVLDAIEAALADDGAFDASERQRLGGLPPDAVPLAPLLPAGGETAYLLAANSEPPELPAVDLRALRVATSRPLGQPADGRPAADGTDLLAADLTSVDLDLSDSDAAFLRASGCGSGRPSSAKLLGVFASRSR